MNTGDVGFHAALAVVLDKRVVLLGSALVQRLEPVGVVRHTILRGPLFHAFGDGIGHLAVKPCAVIHYVNHLLVHVLGQVLIHFLAVEDPAAEILRGTLTGCFYVERLLFESLANDLKS